jgi:hypothetical protein
MIKPSPRQAKALYDLRANTDVLEFMQECLSDCMNRLVTQRDTEVLRNLQGQARAFDHVLTLMRTDPTTQQSGKR